MTDLIKSYTFGEAIAEHTPVKFSQNGVVVTATSPTDKVCGVALYAGQQGAKGDVVALGYALVSTSGAVNAGDILIPAENGKVKALSQDDTGIINTVGQAFDSADNDALLWAVVKPQVLSIPQANEEEQEEQEGES